MVHGKYLQYSSLGLWSNRHNRGAPPCIGTIQLLILVRQLYPINNTINIPSLNLILNCQLLTFEKGVKPNIQLLRYIYHWAVLTEYFTNLFQLLNQIKAILTQQYCGCFSYLRTNCLIQLGHLLVAGWTSCDFNRSTTQIEAAKNLLSVFSFGGFHKWGYPKIDGL